MIRVAYDHLIFNMQSFGGISRYFCEIAAGAAGQPGWGARIVAPLHQNEHLAASTAPRLGLYVPRALPRSKGLRRRICDLATPALLRALRPDVIHRTYYCPQPRPARGALVVTVYDMIHELFPECFAPDDPTPEYKRRCVAAADHVICISHSTANDLTRVLGVQTDKISVTHLGFSESFALRALATPPARRNGRPYLLYVGQRAGYKNFDRVLQAYAASPRLRGEVDLLAFGGDPFFSPDTDRITALGLSLDCVRRIAGSDAELAAAYAGARGFVYPSEYEGFGIPPLEAMSMACPVACSATSSLPEVVGSAGDYFDPRSVDEIRHALERLAFDDSRRSELIAAGHARVKTFSWSRCTGQTLDAYRRVLQ